MIGFTQDAHDVLTKYRNDLYEKMYDMEHCPNKDDPYIKGKIEMIGLCFYIVNGMLLMGTVIQEDKRGGTP